MEHNGDLYHHCYYQELFSQKDNHLPQRLKERKKPLENQNLSKHNPGFPGRNGRGNLR